VLQALGEVLPVVQLDCGMRHNQIGAASEAT
jgi:hypothetical protein